MTQDKKDFIETILMWFRSPKVGNDEELDRKFLASAYDNITQPHWISVEDELPKINPNGSEWDYSDDVLVYLKDGSITVGRWERDNSTGEQYWLLDIEKDLIVTHWMPLPSTEHIADANKKVDRVIGTADHIKTALDVLNKEGG